MSLADKNGRPWAHLQTIKPGDFLVADGDFSCMKEGERRQVRADKNGHGFDRLFISCCDEHGRHYLYGQVGDDGELIGFYPG